MRQGAMKNHLAGLLLLLLLLAVECQAWRRINLARGKTTLQSSVSSSGVASRAVDGKTFTAWNMHSCTKTKKESRPWWGVDLGGRYYVKQVAITNRADCCWQRLSNAAIYVVDTTADGEKLYHLCAPSVTVGRGETKTINCHRFTIGRHVYIRLPKTDVLTLCEVQVFGIRVAQQVGYDRCRRRCEIEGGRFINCARVRKDFTSMSKTERVRFTRTYVELTQRSPYVKQYNKLIEMHVKLFFTKIHKPEQFLPWHRWYILQLENLLRRIDCRVTVPYWDWSLWSGIPWDTKHLWRSTDDGFGGNGTGPHYCVQDGPFAASKFSVAPSAQMKGIKCLRRELNGYPPDAPSVEILLRTRLERFHTFEENLRVDFHNRVHCNFGYDNSHMCSLNSAAAPDFFLHHAFVDKTWHDWQRQSHNHNRKYFSQFKHKMQNISYSPADLHDLMKQPGNVRVMYDNPTHDGAKAVMKKLEGMSFSALQNLPREGFSPISKRALKIFHVTNKERAASRRFERVIAVKHHISERMLHGADKERGFAS